MRSHLLHGLHFANISRWLPNDVHYHRRRVPRSPATNSSIEVIIENIFLIGITLSVIILTAVIVQGIRTLRSGAIGEPSRFKVAAGNLLVLAWLMSILVFGGEIYYRFFVDTTDSFGLTLHTQRWFSRHYHRNPTGFRDSLMLYEAKRTPGVRRVTFLGDSFTAGHGVDDVENRFANIVRKKLPECDVHVFAECGWDTAQEISLFGDFVSQGYEPDVVILVYCLNDLSDISPDWNRALKTIYSESPGMLLNSSYFLNTHYNRLRAARNPDIAHYFHSLLADYDGPVWQQQQLRLRELRTAVQRADGRLLVVTFPFLNAVGEEYPYHSIHTRLGKFWDAENVAHLDLLQQFNSMSPTEITVNPYDAHPNPVAHQIAADAILEFLNQHGIQ
jgi:lysophospholipase L1-like esterase